MNGSSYPVRVALDPQLRDRDRTTTAFRLFLAIPHLILVGGPMALTLSWLGESPRFDPSWLVGGALGPVAAACACFAGFALIFTGRHPRGLRDLSLFYLRWRVRAVAYVALLRDEYPPFEDSAYPARLEVDAPAEPRHRVSIAFRILLAIPHILCVWMLGVAWGMGTMIAWVAILFGGRYPEGLYGFATGVFRWGIRVEAYLLLLTDAYPPFALD